MRYKLRPKIVEATRWFKNGDHPKDDPEMFLDEWGRPFDGEGKIVRYFRHPNVDGDSRCAACRCSMHAHGWIDQFGGTTVCPGDWVVEEHPGTFQAYAPDRFADVYEPVTNDVTDDYETVGPEFEAARTMRQSALDPFDWPGEDGT